jgi:hypothetical protein
MTLSATCSSAEARAYILGFSGLPPLPYPLSDKQLQQLEGLCTINDLGDLPAFEHLEDWQREANFLVLATWITEFDARNLDMGSWHSAITDEQAHEVLLEYNRDNAATIYHACGTAHCMAGFAQTMGGIPAFTVETCHYAAATLPAGTEQHFWLKDTEAMELMTDIVRDHEDAA